ncbi:MAG: FkbM family methyltransferase, partial [Pseudobdellovibrionaceae bacterium]
SGFYVDIGAAHPTKDSVTQFFYQKGWTGINIEPNPNYHSLLIKDRKKDINLCCAISDYDGEAEFQLVKNDPQLSSLRKISNHLVQDYKLNVCSESVKVFTLQAILDKYKVSNIDFLKIDAEGSEKEVLLGLDFSKFSARIILIESIAAKSKISVRDHWESILISQNYCRVYFDGINDYFVKKEDTAAIEALSIPLNSSDNCIRSEFLKPRFLLKSFIKTLSWI